MVLAKNANDGALIRITDMMNDDASNGVHGWMSSVVVKFVIPARYQLFSMKYMYFDIVGFYGFEMDVYLGGA
jgi:hypothetical protein